MRSALRRTLLAATAALVCAAPAPPARASIWQQALEGPSEAAAREAYDKGLRDGDEHILIANAKSGARSEMKRQVQLAVTAYRAAATARPTAAEPYFRIAAALYSFYLDNCFESSIISRSPLRDCDRPDLINTAMARETVAAWDAAEARAPLDPRFSAGEGENVLFSRALLNTRLNTRDSLAAAARDYEQYIDRADRAAPNLENALGNVAETYMMLGRIEDAITAYREAVIRRGTNVSTVYGLAVALDRGERPTLARQLIAQQGAEGYETFRRQVDSGQSFYVPQGEVFYYFALAEQTLGDPDRAIEYWRMFLGSGAHPAYQPRAKEHLAALVKQRPAPPARRPPLWDAR